jgi:hypothetical protein
MFVCVGFLQLFSHLGMKKYFENLVLVLVDIWFLYLVLGFTFRFHSTTLRPFPPKGGSTAPSGGGVTDKISDVFLGGGYEINL